MTVERPVEGLAIHQPDRGFRYGAEAFWVAGFALEGGRPGSVLDLGTGSGIIAALFAAQGLLAVGVDVRPEWSALWTATQRDSQVHGRLDLRTADVRDLPSADYELIVSNPPFFSAGSGPKAADPWKAAARTESSSTLADFVAAAVRSVRADGRSCWVIPRDREADLLRAARNHGLGPARTVDVGRLRTLVELRAGSGNGVREAISESDPRVAAWYALTGARNRA